MRIVNCGIPSIKDFINPGEKLGCVDDAEEQAEDVFKIRPCRFISIVNMITTHFTCAP
jgi:hypothetical protein